MAKRIVPAPLIAIALALAFGLPPAAGAADDAVVKAMRDELARSTKKLQLEQLEKPYFISYTVIDSDNKSASATFGSLVSSMENRSRFLRAEVRVGDYAFDNTNFFSMPSFGGTGVVRTFGGIVPLPLDDNYDEIRRQLWLATDGAYKKAVEDLAKKRAVLQNRNRTDNAPDFSKEKPATVEERLPAVQIDLKEAEDLTKSLSAVFRQAPNINNSSVRLSASNSLTRYLNSEGTSFVTFEPAISLTARAATQAPDGMGLSDFVAFYGRARTDLPSKQEMAAGIRDCATRLAGLRDAKNADRYIGPVLFEGQGAAELLAQVFLPQVLGAPRLVYENPQMERSMGPGEIDFVDKIGARVLPDFLSLVDDPTAAVYNRVPLFGSQKVDEDGVPARRNTVIENGILKTLLTARSPVRGIPQSTGNHRSSGLMPTNVFLTATKAISSDQLRAELLRIAKQRGNEYGIVVRRIENPTVRSADSGVPAFNQRLARIETALAYKVFPDGREELIRNAEITGLTPASFKEIVAASDVQTTYTAPFQVRNQNPFMGFMPGGSSLVSYVVPALLFEDVSVNKPSGDFPTPPVSKHPFFDK